MHPANDIHVPTDAHAVCLLLLFLLVFVCVCVCVCMCVCVCLLYVRLRRVQPDTERSLPRCCHTQPVHTQTHTHTHTHTHTDIHGLMHCLAYLSVHWSSTQCVSCTATQYVDNALPCSASYHQNLPSLVRSAILVLCAVHHSALEALFARHLGHVWDSLWPGRQHHTARSERDCTGLAGGRLVTAWPTVHDQLL